LSKTAVIAFPDFLFNFSTAAPQLMALLEKEGPDFADKMLVTIVGG
jgi:hypothetical protein